MGIYAASIGSKAGTNTANTPVCVLWSTGGTLIVKQLSLWMVTAMTTAPDFYVARISTRGTTPTTVTGQQYDPNDNAATGGLDTAWGGTPTVGAILGRLPMPNVVGASFVDSLETLDGYIVRNGAGLAIINANASGATLGAVGYSVRWRE